jgi:large subunit ribosomal protein L10
LGLPAQTLSRVCWERRDILNREQKEQVIAELKEKFEAAKGMVITEYKGMSVAEMNDFRDSLREASIEYRVLKNTLARIAAEETPAAPARENFTGPVGVALGYDDPVSVAKAVLDFAKKNEKLKVTSGVIEGELLDAARLKSISQLPPREVLLSMLAGGMQAPSGKLARLLGATLTQMGYAMNALREKRAQEQ